jgi:iron donor protein CyaY
MDESHYRKIVDDVFRRIDVAFENVDPDLAESAFSQGTLVITIREKYKLILSPQAPVRQIWAAYRDRAWHFSLDETTQTWRDDRGQDQELFQLVASLTAEHAGIKLSFTTA